MNLSYNAWKTYTECPKHYVLEHRDHVTPPVPKNDYPRLYGNLVQRFFEMYCNTWRFKSCYMPPEVIHEKMAQLWESILQTSQVDWTAQWSKLTAEQILDQAVMDTCAILDSPNQNYFLNSKSEIEIKIALKKGHALTGRLDFIHVDPINHEQMHIFDGKGSSKMGRNVDVNQLYFYALLFFFQYKKLPASLGFFYFRFNVFKPVPFDLKRLNDIRVRISTDLKDIISRTSFDATPSWKSCQYCLWQVQCNECQQFRASRKRSKLNIGDGVTEFGF